MIEGNEVIRRIQSGEENENLPHELLHELYRGYPVAELPKLFDSTDVEIVKSAAWIVSELGVKGRPILDATAKLLLHPSKYVRFFAIDSVLACATSEHTDFICDVVRLLRDPEPAVRWKVMDFLARIATDHLTSTADSSFGADPPGEIVKKILTLCTNPDVDVIISHLNSENGLERQMGAIAAARISRQDPMALEQALSNRDQEVRQFARSFNSKPGK